MFVVQLRWRCVFVVDSAKCPENEVLAKLTDVLKECPRICETDVRTLTVSTSFSTTCIHEGYITKCNATYTHIN